MCTVPKYTLDNPINLIQYALTFDYQKAHQTVKCKLPFHASNTYAWSYSYTETYCHWKCYQ